MYMATLIFTSKFNHTGVNFALKRACALSSVGMIHRHQKTMSPDNWSPHYIVSFRSFHNRGQNTKVKIETGSQ